MHYLDYVTAAGKSLQMASGAATIAPGQNFKLEFVVKISTGVVRLLGRSSSSSAINFTNLNTLSLVTDANVTSSITIPADSTNFRKFEIWRTDGANINIRIDNGGTVTVAQAGGYTFNRLFASIVGVSVSAAVQYISLELDGVLTNRWENSTGTGTSFQDSVASLNFNQVGTWPAGDTEWVLIVPPTAPTHYLKFDGVDDTATFTSISFNIGTGSYTIRFRGNVRTLPPSGQVRGIFGASSANIQGLMVQPDGSLSMYENNNQAYVTNSGFIIPGEVHDYILEHEASGTYRFFRDGVLLRTNSYTTDTMVTTNRIAQNNSSATRSAIDFYLGEIVVGASTVRWEPSLSGGTGNTLFSVGNVNNATMTNFTTVDADKWISLIASVLATLKYWTGSAWVSKPLKYWNGSSWVQKVMKYWNGSSWVAK